MLNVPDSESPAFLKPLPSGEKKFTGQLFGMLLNPSILMHGGAKYVVDRGNPWASAVAKVNSLNVDPAWKPGDCVVAYGYFVWTKSILPFGGSPYWRLTAMANKLPVPGWMTSV